ncbi:uncharacterized protein LOC144032145 isoform X3 [Festucalex cinctus]
MCKVQMLRALLNQRLSAAVEEIFVVFERTIAEYEEELCRTKEENRRQRQLLDAFTRAVVSEDLSTEQQELSSRVEQQEPEAEAPCVKEEKEEHTIGQEGEPLQELEEEEILLKRVIVKSNDDEGDGDHCGGSKV